MSFNVVMPALGESVTEGTVTRWLKNEGDQVAVDEPLLEVSTDKVDTEIPSPVAGTVAKILVAVDQTVPVGAELVVINDGSPAAAALPVAAPVAAPVAPVAPVIATPATPAAPVSNTAAEIVVMPALGESVTEGTVTRWLKSVGEAVAMDEALLEVSTDKVDTEIPSPVAGTVSEIFAPADSVVPVGGKLAAISSSGGVSAPVAPTTPAVSVAPVAPVAAQHAPVNTIPAPAAQGAQGAQNKGVESDSYVTPLVRKLAAELQVDLASISGTGVGGRIRKQDVYDAAERARATAPVAIATPTPVQAVSAPSTPAAAISASPLRGTSVPMTRLRKVIASRMVESLQTSAQLTTVIEVDVTKIAKLRVKAKNSFQEREGVNLTFLPFFAVAVCEALKQHPVVNASIDGENIVYHGTENLGIAVDTERGLLVPVIKDAGDLNLGGLARRINDVALRTRESKINPDELSGGTFTITNTGSRGALFDTPIINQPQVAILGIGSIVKRPVVITEADGEEKIAIRSMVYLAISYDHRIVDGADAARFLGTLKERLELGRFEADLGI
ncbi:MAG: 2-oxoglutarate dehydrogenase, E2 component, dihydrolipoamide succinyltransferase [Actinobacteria bacterium]|nr:2-oxoglutarate dehydrogenase, E2 component, dihydrolipoamide succinyltransferase [Actinomycetota bacterium]